MKDERMPEQIHVKPYTEDGCYRLCSDNREEYGDVEYVRADLVQGDANEPLAYGQYRWVKPNPDCCNGLKKQKTEWIVIRVDMMLDDLDFDFEVFSFFDGAFFTEDEILEIGPVIRPPEELTYEIGKNIKKLDKK